MKLVHQGCFFDANEVVYEVLDCMSFEALWLRCSSIKPCRGT